MGENEQANNGWTWGMRVAAAGLLVAVAACWWQGQADRAVARRTELRLRQEMADTQRDLKKLRDEVAGLRQEIAQSQFAAAKLPAGGENQLQKTVQALGSRNLLVQYEAGLLLRQYGDEAVPPLCQVVQGNDSRARTAALAVLGAMSGAAAAQAVRQTATAMLADREANSPALAAMLGLLARRKDGEALPVFRQALAHRSPEVRAAGISGLRVLRDTASLPLLVEHLGGEPPLVQAEVERCLMELVQADSARVLEELEKLPPKSRFELVKLLLRHDGEASRRLMDQLSRDRDPRVAAGAKRAIELLGQALHPVAGQAPASPLDEVQKFWTQLRDTNLTPSDPGKEGTTP